MSRGRSTIYRPKSLPNVSVCLALPAAEALEAAARRTGQSRSTIVEHLVRVYSAEIDLNSHLTLYSKEVYPPALRRLTFSLTAVAKRSLASNARRLSVSRSRLVKHLISTYAHKITSEAFRKLEEDQL